MPLKSKTANERLDDILRELNRHPSISLYYANLSALISTVKGEPTERENILTYSMLQYLQDDGYVRETKEEDDIWIQITFKGMKFIESGGYCTQSENECRETVRGKRIENYMAAGAIFAAVFSLLFLLWDMAKYFHDKGFVFLWWW